MKRLRVYIDTSVVGEWFDMEFAEFAAESMAILKFRSLKKLV